MKQHVAAILAFLSLIVSANAEPALPEGEFQVVNTAAFEQAGGIRTPLDTGPQTGKVEIEIQANRSIELSINGTRIVLFPHDAGLAGLDWDAEGSGLMAEIDIEALNLPGSSEDIPVWGAELAWPGLGLVRMVVMPLGSARYAGFLISFPDNRTVVRQMEFRQDFGPLNRPASTSVALKSAETHP